MDALTTAIYGRCTSSTTLYTLVNGQLYKGRAPADAEAPYVVFFVVSDVPSYTFTEDFENVMIQFSIFSEASGTSEIEAIFNAVRSLYDDTTFSPTNEKVVIMTRTNASLLATYNDTEIGTSEGWQYDIDYDVLVSRS